MKEVPKKKEVYWHYWGTHLWAWSAGNRSPVGKLSCLEGWKRSRRVTAYLQASGLEVRSLYQPWLSHGLLGESAMLCTQRKTKNSLEITNKSFMWALQGWPESWWYPLRWDPEEPVLPSCLHSQIKWAQHPLLLFPLWHPWGEHGAPSSNWGC